LLTQDHGLQVILSDTEKKKKTAFTLGMKAASGRSGQRNLTFSFFSI
jgi:hypothetical protein